MSEFNIDPQTWPCLGTSYKSCATCRRTLKTVTESHVFPCFIPEKLQDGSKKVPTQTCQQFCAIVNALLNTLEGGFICVHLDSALHGQFLQQTSGKLRDMRPTGCAYSHTYRFVKETDHIYFSVLPAEEGGRGGSTFDFRVKLPRTVGLEPPSQDEVRTLVLNASRSAGQAPHPYHFPQDPEFIAGRVLPDSFGENLQCQVKAAWDRDTEKAAGYNRGEKLATYAMGKVGGYICAFAMEGGGCIYLGLSEAKEPAGGSGGRGSQQVSWRAARNREDDLLCTDRYRCDGIQMSQDDMNDFRRELEAKVNAAENIFSDPPTLNLFDRILRVEFLKVKDAKGGDTELRVVKLRVGYFGGLLFPHPSGPLAFLVKENWGRSQVVRASYQQWKAAICQSP